MSQLHGLPEALAERFEPLERLAEGECGAVFRVRPREGGEEVVLRWFRRAEEAAEQERILGQVKAVAALDCPALAEIRGAGTSPAGPYVLLEPLGGVPPTDPACPASVLEVLRSLAEVLATFHKAGLVHGDLRPANVRVEADGRVRVMGVAFGADPRRLEPEEGPPRMGWAQFMAPQLYLLKRPSAGDDWFAWAVTGWLLAEGDVPYAAEDQEVCARKQSLPRLKPARLEPKSPLFEALTGCLAYTPQDRSVTIAKVPELLAAAEDPGRPEAYAALEPRTLPERPVRVPRAKGGGGPGKAAPPPPGPPTWALGVGVALAAGLLLLALR